MRHDCGRSSPQGVGEVGEVGVGVSVTVGTGWAKPRQNINTTKLSQSHVQLLSKTVY